MPTPPDRRTARTVYVLTVAGTAVWLAAAFLAPELAGSGRAGAARLLYAVFAPVCHQIPERCFTFHGHPLAVCVRCLGVYAGFAAGLGLYPLVRGFSRLTLPPARPFVLSVLPLAIDGLGGLLGLWASPAGVRFATGLVWGVLLPFFFVPGLSDLLITRRKRKAIIQLEKSGTTQ